MRSMNGHDELLIDSEAETSKSLNLLRNVATALATAVEAIESVQAPDFSTGLDFYEEVQRFEVVLIQRALRHTGGNQAHAARLLGLKQTTLHGKIKQYRIQSQVMIFNSAPLKSSKELQDQRA